MIHLYSTIQVRCDNLDINMNFLSKETYNGIIKYILSQQFESKKNAPKLLK